MTKRILLVNGPNLNLLGNREPEIYGSTTLAEIEAACIAHGKTLGFAVTCKQSNVEGELVNIIQAARGTQDAIIINPGAYSHTSVAIMDALSAFEGTIIEVHLSNIFKREAFRHHSYVSMVAKGVICGLGAQGYLRALDALTKS